MRRSRGRRQKHENTGPDDSLDNRATDRGPTDAGAKLDLMQMLDTLDEEDRALLILKYAEGHSYEELSEMFDLSISACKMRVSRACDKLQARFGAPEEEDIFNHEVHEGHEGSTKKK